MPTVDSLTCRGCSHSRGGISRAVPGFDPQEREAPPAGWSPERAGDPREDPGGIRLGVAVRWPPLLHPDPPKDHGRESLCFALLPDLVAVGTVQHALDHARVQ